MPGLDPVVLALPFRGRWRVENSPARRVPSPRALQAMDAADPFTARGLPLAFRDHRSWPRDGGPPVAVPLGVPAEGAVVEPV